MWLCLKLDVLDITCGGIHGHLKWPSDINRDRPRSKSGSEIYGILQTMSRRISYITWSPAQAFTGAVLCLLSSSLARPSLVSFNSRREVLQVISVPEKVFGGVHIFCESCSKSTHWLNFSETVYCMSERDSAALVSEFT
jgi:hypothetical protein